MGSMQDKAWEAVVSALAERVKNGPRGELSAIAGQIGATRGTVSRWLSGGLKGKRIPYDKMLRIMRALGLDPAEYFGPQGRGGQLFAPGLLTEQPSAYAAAPSAGQQGAPAQRAGHAATQPESEPGYYQVPWLEARASMGGGSLEVSKEVRSYLSFRRDWLLSKGPAGNMVVVSVQGDSMSPTIPDGSVVLISEQQSVPPVHGKIYLVCYRDELFIKRLKVQGGRVTALVSDLDSSEIPVKKSEYFNVIGRAIWYGKDL